MVSYKPKNSKKVKRYSPRRGGKIKGADRRAIHKQEPSMADIIGDTVSKKKKGEL